MDILKTILKLVLAVWWLPTSIFLLLITQRTGLPLFQKIMTDLLRNSLTTMGSLYGCTGDEGVASVFLRALFQEALVAGNDMLWPPGKCVAESIEYVKKLLPMAGWPGRIFTANKVLASKFELIETKRNGLIQRTCLLTWMQKTDAIKYEVAQHSITLLAEVKNTASRNDYASVPLKNGTNSPGKIAYIGIGTNRTMILEKECSRILVLMCLLFHIKTARQTRRFYFAAGTQRRKVWCDHHRYSWIFIKTGW